MAPMSFCGMILHTSELFALVCDTDNILWNEYFFKIKYSTKNAILPRHDPRYIILRIRMVIARS